MDKILEIQDAMNRRTFLTTACSVGLAALAGLLGEQSQAAPSSLKGLPHYAPKARRVIYLFQSGAPSQMELFDYKPKLADYRGSELPDSIRMGQRLTGMTSTQTSFPVAPSLFHFAQHGNSGAWVSELMPHTAEIAD